MSVWDLSGCELVSTVRTDDIRSTIIEKNNSINRCEECCIGGVTIAPIMLGDELISYLVLHSVSLDEMVKSLCINQVMNFYKQETDELELGQGRIERTLCKTFLDEVLNGNAIEQFDDEIMNAVHIFSSTT